MSKLKECIQNKIEKNIRCNKPILLNNCSFRKGTYRITKPGYYKLQENIIFNPLVNDIFLPKKFSKKYPRNVYFLGFFAAITIECNYVILDLNDFKIEMDPLFSIFQRFFSIIELANTPFVRNEGPTGSFDDNGVRPANYLIIKNGCIGNSSHSAIHGNNNKYIVIENLVCKDFETSGIVLNNVKKSVIENCEIGPSNKKVLVNSLFFPFVNLVRIIISNNLHQSNNKCYKNILIFKEAVAIFYKIIDNYKLYNTIFDKKDNFYNNIIAEFYNISGLPDGSALYGLSFTAAGISVKGFGCCLEKNPKEGRSKNIYIDNVKINCLCLNTMETIAMKIDDKIIRGAFGEIITPMDTSKFITDLQFSMWDYILRNPDLNIKTTFNKDVTIYQKTRMLYDKIRFKIDLPEKINYKIEFGGDIMNHYNKGIVGIRVEYVETIFIKNITISYLENLTKKTLMNKDDNKILIKHDKINMFESLESYIGTAIFGIICLESKCIINNYSNNNLNSTNGEICECISI